MRISRRPYLLPGPAFGQVGMDLIRKAHRPRSLWWIPSLADGEFQWPWFSPSC